MCANNDEQTICDNQVIKLLRSSDTHITFGAHCNKMMFQHIIRLKLSSSEVKWKELGSLKKDMFLVRPDGSSWGNDFDQVVATRLIAALQYRRRKLVDIGAFDFNNMVWCDWAEGFLHPAWSGLASRMSRANGEKLLAKLRQNSNEEQLQQKNAAPSAPDPSTPTEPPEAVAMGVPSQTIYPCDAVSNTSVDRGRPGCRSIAEIEADIVAGTRNLIEFGVFIDDLQFGPDLAALPNESPGKQQHRDPQGMLRQARQLRWGLVTQLTELEKELDIAWYTRLFGGEPTDHDVDALAAGKLRGRIWLHFLGAEEERYILARLRRKKNSTPESVQCMAESFAATAL